MWLSADKVIYLGVFQRAIEIQDVGGFREWLVAIAALDSAIIGVFAAGFACALRAVSMSRFLAIWFIAWALTLMAVDLGGRILFGPDFQISH